MKKYKKIKIKSANVHCHFMTFDHLPDEYTRRMLKIVKGINITWIPEWIIKKVLGSFSLNFINFLNKPIKTWVYKAMRDKYTWDNVSPKSNGAVDNYLYNGEFIKKRLSNKDKDIKNMTYCITKQELETNSFKIKEASDMSSEAFNSYEFVVPLMMDMVTASNIFLVPNNNGVVEFGTQIEQYSETVAKYPFRVYPFIMFNPMRKDSYDRVVDAIHNRGFIGIKMYPAMGFYADPYRNTFKDCIWKDNCINRVECKKLNKSLCCSSLEKLYRFADDNRLPITAHSQYESMQNIVLRSRDAAKFTDVQDFCNVLKDYPNIRVNFAHFGGIEFITNTRHMNNKNREGRAYRHSCKCRNDIAFLMRRFNSANTRVFTDTSANVLSSYFKRKRYFKVLYSLFDNESYMNGIMFGTDSPAISICCSDRSFWKTFVKGLAKQHIKAGGKVSDSTHRDIENRFFFENAINFLFGARREIPKSYINFLNSRFSNGVDNVPKWIQ